MKKIITLCVVLSAYTFGNSQTTFKTESDKVSYAIGLSIAQSMANDKLEKEINLDVLKQAMSDKFNNQTLAIPEDSVRAVIQKYFNAKQEKIKAANLLLGQKFLDENKKKKGVIVTPSSLQYEVITKGTGKDHPSATDVVTVKYSGKKLDGSEFDSTDKNNGGKALDIPLNNVIKGWTEGIQLMTNGAKYRFYIPANLAYGERSAGPISPNETLIFEVELESFKAQEAKPEATKMPETGVKELKKMEPAKKAPVVNKTKTTK